MALNIDEFCGLESAGGYRIRIGPRIEQCIKQLFQHANQPEDSLLKLVKAGEIESYYLGKLTKGINESVRGIVCEKSVSKGRGIGGSTLAETACKTFMQQMEKWDIPEELISFLNSRSPDHSHRRGWFNYHTIGQAKKLGISELEHCSASIKMMNVFCEFYFGERLFSNIHPTETYTPVTWDDVQAKWLQQQEGITPIADISQKQWNDLQDAGFDEATWQKLWETGCLQCIIPCIQK